MAKSAIFFLALALFNASAVMSLKLMTNDNEIFDTTVEIASTSITIKHLLGDLDIDEEEEMPVPLAKVSSKVLTHMLRWMEHHQNDPEPVEGETKAEKRTDDIPEWDREFLKLDQGVLFELIEAANYLDIPNLVDAACKTVANMIKGKSPEEIRATFNIQDGFSAAEEEQIRKENQMFKN